MRIIVGSMILALGGCSNAMNFKPTMASDPPQLGIEGIALANELSKAYIRSDDTEICSKLHLGFQESRKSTLVRYSKNGITAREIFSCVGFREAEPEKIKMHVRSGLALSDYFCDNFFERIAEHSGKRKFARNITNDVGAMVSTVLGLAAAGSAVTGGIGAGFGLLDSSWRNYDDNFLVSADLPTLQKLVYSEQDKFRTNLTMPDNYPDATNVIIRYANLCSFVGMQSLLTKSMTEKTATNTAETGKSDAQAKKAAAAAVDTPPKQEVAPSPPTG